PTCGWSRWWPTASPWSSWPSRSRRSSTWSSPRTTCGRSRPWARSVTCSERHPGGATMAEYLWEQGDEDELTRLRSLEALYVVHAFDVVARMGVGAGWRCAEVGAGAGSVTEWLCDRVGPTGRVVAVDIPTTFLEPLGHGNLDVRCADVVAEPLEAGAYDLVHARTLLEHLATREEVVAQFAAALRPGGVLVAEDVLLTG